MTEKSLDEFPNHSKMKDGKLNKCKNCERTYQQSYKSQNKLHLTEYNSKYCKQRRDSNEMLRLIGTVRSAVGAGFRKGCNGRYKKAMPTEQILGCTIPQFIKHIESKFTPGMTFDNYGQFKGKWQLDHIIPVSSAKTEEDVIKLNHYSNFQPLWWEDNMKKFNKLP